MMRSEAIAIIKRGLGFRQTQDTAIIAALKQAQIDLETGKSLPEWLVEYRFQLSYVGDRVELPDRFLRVHEEYPLVWVNAVNGERGTLPLRHPEEANEAYPQPSPPEAGIPQVFILEAAHIRPVPLTTTPLTLYLTFYRGATTLDAEGENAWLKYASNYIVGLAGMKVAGDLRDAGALQKFTAMAKMGGQSYMGAIVDRELAGRPLIMGRNN